MDRRAVILKDLNIAGQGLEIGAGYDPLVAGDPQFDVRVLDHLDQEGLKRKYLAEGLDVSRVPFVDYVWSGQRYADMMGRGIFDYVVASHVIEHVPDMIEFLNQCAEILKPGGVFTLAVPDRRHTFDRLRPNTSLSAVIDAHVQKRTLSSPGSAAEHLLYSTESNGRIIWAEKEPADIALRYGTDAAQLAMSQASAGQYVDIHAWVFTPASFRMLTEDLYQLNLIPLRERSWAPTNGFEFYIQLARDGAGPEMDRLALASLTLAEG